MATFVACDDKTSEKQEDNIPTKPIEEKCYTPEKTRLEVWATTAESAIVRQYNGDSIAEEVVMTKGEKGLWSAEVEGDKKGMYYAFQITIDGKTLKETAGIFARALDVNGNRGAIIDMRDTDPKGWSEDKSP
jgi:pullulanase